MTVERSRIHREVLVANDKLLDRARDELFSHINRCGVLHASPEDQKIWMTETIDYLAERYPDLADGNLDQLHGIGLRFCQPAIARGASSEPVVEGEIEAEVVAEVVADEVTEVEPEGATVA